MKCRLTAVLFKCPVVWQRGSPRKFMLCDVMWNRLAVILQIPCFFLRPLLLFASVYVCVWDRVVKTMKLSTRSEFYYSWSRSSLESISTLRYMDMDPFKTNIGESIDPWICRGDNTPPPLQPPPPPPPCQSCSLPLGKTEQEPISTVDSSFRQVFMCITLATVSMCVKKENECTFAIFLFRYRPLFVVSSVVLLNVLGCRLTY